MSNATTTPSIARHCASALVAVLAVAAVALAAAPGAEARPAVNLKLWGLTAAPDTVAPGAKFAVAGKVGNRGRARARARILIFLRKGRTRGGTRAVARRVIGVRGRSRRVFAFRVAVPAGTEPGRYRVLACTRKGGRRGADACRGAKRRLTVRSSEPATPPDSDGDGVPDPYDQCPGVAGSPLDGGCPPLGDGDSDGVPDIYDACPAVPGEVASAGCPPAPDSDGDTVPDEWDACPGEPGEPGNGGCPPEPDSDGDGIPDAYDHCVDDPGTVPYGGCPPPPEDSDGDGIIDLDDDCPDVPGDPPDGCPPEPNFTSGARTLGDPLFPEVGNGGYDVTHYDIAFSYDNVTNSFGSGTRTIVTAEATHDLSDFSLDLQGLTVSAVKVNGADASSFNRLQPPTCSPASPPNPSCPISKLEVYPADPIGEGEEFTVEVTYSGTPVRHRDADGTDEGWLNTPNGDGAFVVNEPVGAMTWFPNNNHPLDKATYEFHLTVPTGRTALGNGELTGPPVDNGNGTTTWNWRHDHPMATYLSTATVGNFDLTTTQMPEGITLYDAVDSSATLPQKLLVGNSTAREPAIIRFLTSAYGDYPFDSGGTVADSAGNVGYVLEVQTKIHFPSPSIGLGTLAHEYGHQWFGDNVGLTTWKEIWQNEGWATWTDWYWSYHENNGTTTPEQQFTTNYTAGSGTACPGGTNKWCRPPTDPSAATLFSTFPIYTRGAMMLEALRQIVGDNKFFKIARRWNAENAYDSAQTADFIALSKEVSGFTGADLARLDLFFQQWLYLSGMPTITGSNFFS